MLKRNSLIALAAGSALAFTSAAQAALTTYYTFDGNANDSAGTANLTATATGTPTFSPTGASTQTGGSAVFSGTGDFNVASSRVFQSTPNFSVSFFVNPTTAANADVIRQANNGPGGFAFLIDSNGYDAFVYGAGGTSVHGNATTLVPGTFANIVVTFADSDGVADASGVFNGTASLYVNGGTVTGGVRTPTATVANVNYTAGGTSNLLGIGGRGNSATGGFNGRIDDFAVFNNVLSSSDIGTIAGGAPASSVVPEPAALAVVGLGAIATLRRKRR